MDRANAVAVQGERVFTAGFVDNTHSSRDFTVRAYDAGTGELLWQDQLDGTAGGFDEARAIVVQGEQVFTAGTVTNFGSESDFTVRAYAAGTGKLLWQDQFDGTVEFSLDRVNFDRANALTVQGERVFAVGVVRDDGFAYEGSFTLRTYAAETGELLWQDRFAGTARGGYASAVTVQEERVFAAGEVDNADRGKDFTVRAYQLR